LSSTTMKRASDTTASVAPVRVFAEAGDMRGGLPPGFEILSDC
jgi:hypothetical protein